MSIYYLDTSALVKYYILEPGSTWVRGLVDSPVPEGQSRGNLVFIAEISLVESAAAFSVLYRTNRIGKKARDGALNLCMEHISTGVLLTIPVRTVDFHLAADLTHRYPLKAYDAVQLATAIRYENVLATRQQTSLVFVSGDNTLNTAAVAEGLAVDNPFDHVSSDDTVE